MPTICIVHGVGYDSVPAIYKGKIQGFANSLRQATGAQTVLYPWLRKGSPPPDPRNGPLFDAERTWMAGIIMDFSYVLYNLDALTQALPVADMYIGHSAGALIVAAKTDKPQVLMGNPSQLVSAEHTFNMASNGTNTLNLMHYRDPIAAPVNNATNNIMYQPFWTSMLNPFVAHTSYFEAADVLNQCVSWYNRFVLPEIQKLVTAHAILKGRTKK